jgi:integrase
MHHLGIVTFGGLCDRYIAEALPERYSTRKSYLSNINLHIKPRWGGIPHRGSQGDGS